MASLEKISPVESGQRQEASRPVAGSISSSLVREAAWSLDAGPWNPANPIDGLADSADESYDLILPSPGRGEHSIVVRATDTTGNSGSGRALITIP